MLRAFEWIVDGKQMDVLVQTHNDLVSLYKESFRLSSAVILTEIRWEFYLIEFTPFPAIMTRCSYNLVDHVRLWQYETA